MLTNKVYLVSEDVLRQVLDVLNEYCRKHPAAETLRVVLAKEPSEPVGYFDGRGRFFYVDDPFTYGQQFEETLYRKDL